MSLRSKSEESHLKQLQELRDIVAEKIDSGPGARDLGQLAKQYREIVGEIAEIIAQQPQEDDIELLLQQRKMSGKPGRVR